MDVILFAAVFMVLGALFLKWHQAGVSKYRKYEITQADQIKHFDKTHFTAVTIGGRKFVYCPVGNICSWSEGDYDHKWCHWCKKYFSEVQ